MSDLLFVWFPVIAAVAAAVFGVFLLYIGSRAYVNAVFLQRDGVAGRATVVRCYKERIIISRQDHSRHVARYNNLVDFPPIGFKPPASSRSASANLSMIFSPEF